MAFHLLLIAVPVGVICIAVLVSLNRAKHNQLRQIAGPPVHHLFDNHLRSVLDPSISPQVHQHYVSRYGRSIRIRGIGFWDDRLLTLDPVSVSHILKNTSIYQKPWQSRKFISSLIGCGLLAAEGETHRRQRRVASPAFSAHNLHALVPLVFRKAIELKDKWVDLVHMQSEQVDARVDVCHWISRATFDVIGLAGFEYDFNAIHDETNELFSAYKEMFEVSISQARMLRSLVGIYLPWIAILFPDKATRTVRDSQSIIRRVAGKLIQAKKQRIMEGENGNDLLSLLLASNLSEELAAHQRISDEDILHNINTFMFAGSDTSSLTLTWTLWLLAQHPEVQDRLRCELLSIMPKTSAGDLTDEELLSLYDSISNLPYLHNVTRETIRLIPPVHSSIRVATEDDEIPTAYPVRKRDGSAQEKKSVSVAKGTLIHVAIEGFNLDKEIWGEDAWDFNPDRWERLPERVSSLPGLFSNTLTFSAGPRSCIGMRFAMIEIKTVVYMLVAHFRFRPTEERIMKANVVLTRPYVRGRYGWGSQCPLFVGMSRGGDKERGVTY
ncbi:Cytochrome P450 [Amanita muscaria]